MPPTAFASYGGLFVIVEGSFWFYILRLPNGSQLKTRHARFGDGVDRVNGPIGAGKSSNNRRFISEVTPWPIPNTLVLGITMGFVERIHD